MIADELKRRLQFLKQAADEFAQMIHSVDMNFETKETQVKNLELKISKLKEEMESVQNKANGILQQASEEAASTKKQADKYLEEALQSKNSTGQNEAKARALMDEAQGLMAQAVEKQKTADAQWHILEQRKKKLEEAIR